MIQNIDLIIRNGIVYDGSGGEPLHVDIAIDKGIIVGLGEIDRPANREIDAAGCIVTPGFVDVHTHYDGHTIWSNRLEPSSYHGVTTVVVGNCGIGFAPCREEDRATLVSAMEGVEDIPEAVMTEGLTWNWESFPEFLDVLENLPHDIDIAAYIPHSALRVYAMGARGANREPASAADIREMSRIVDEAMAAGAMGVASSRTWQHRRIDGQHLPSFKAAEQELLALSRAIGGKGRGVFQIVPELQDDDEEDTRRNIEMLARMSLEGQIPVTFTLVTSSRLPDRWRKVLEWVTIANQRPGVELRPQIYPRPNGMLLGHNCSNNPFILFPSYQPLLKMPLAEKVAELRKPEVRARLLSEEPIDGSLPVALFGVQYDRMFALGDPPNYEPRPEEVIPARAKALGISPKELVYDLLLEQDGHAMICVGMMNFVPNNGSLDFVLELVKHPDTIVGIGDGGAHSGFICDASYTTFMLTHWSRDRQGEKLPLSAVIKSLTAEPADLVGLYDRGRIKPGCKADINIIDYEKLYLHAPEVHFDLPGGGRRLHQYADGYRYTIVSGEPIFQDGVATGNLPGRLVRRSAYSAAQAAE